MLRKILIPGGKAQVQHTREGMEITVNLPRNIPVIAFLSFWLCGWAMGEIFAAGALISMIVKAKSIADIGPGFFLLFWLSGWSLGGYFAITTVLRSALGRDVININSSQISINEKIGNWGKPKLYDVPSIKNLRVLENPGPSTTITPRTAGVQGGPVLAFDYDGNTVHFVKGLNLSELEAILDAIWENNYLEQENFAKSVIKNKLGEEDDWEEGTDKSTRGSGGLPGRKTAERKVADSEASAQWQSETINEDGKKDDSDEIYYADL